MELVAVCPKCRNQVSKPDRELHNCVFHIASYTCQVCKTHFKISQ